MSLLDKNSYVTTVNVYGEDSEDGTYLTDENGSALADGEDYFDAFEKVLVDLYAGNTDMTLPVKFILH